MSTTGMIEVVEEDLCDTVKAMTNHRVAICSNSWILMPARQTLRALFEHVVALSFRSFFVRPTGLVKCLQTFKRTNAPRALALPFQRRCSVEDGFLLRLRYIPVGSVHCKIPSFSLGSRTISSSNEECRALELLPRRLPPRCTRTRTRILEQKNVPGPPKKCPVIYPPWEIRLHRRQSCQPMAAATSRSRCTIRCHFFIMAGRRVKFPFCNEPLAKITWAVMMTTKTSLGWSEHFRTCNPSDQRCWDN